MLSFLSSLLFQFPIVTAPSSRSVLDTGYDKVMPRYPARVPPGSKGIGGVDTHDSGGWQWGSRLNPARPVALQTSVPTRPCISMLQVHTQLLIGSGGPYRSFEAARDSIDGPDTDALTAIPAPDGMKLDPHPISDPHSTSDSRIQTD